MEVPKTSALINNLITNLQRSGSQVSFSSGDLLAWLGICREEKVNKESNTSNEDPICNKA
jgi:hypothetical protein